MASSRMFSPLPGPRLEPLLTCRLCGNVHVPVPLDPGQRATCERCGTLLAGRGRLGPHAAPAFALAGLVLSWPAVALPFITVAKFGDVRTTWVHSGAEGLWDGGMRLLAAGVLFFGTLAPLLLFGLLAGLLCGQARCGVLVYRRLLRLARSLDHWSMPEVHVLAVLVALFKLGTLVDVFIGPGFWCYIAMSLMLVLAWRSFEFDSAEPLSSAPRALP